MNKRIKTLWSINGRSPDSRDEWDSTGLGLKVGRVDIPASLMIVVDGYDKVTYVRTSSDGSKSEHASIVAALTVSGTEPVVETVHGSGVMTFFINGTESNTPGINRIDVIKEWEAVDPEPEPIAVEDLSGISYRGVKLIKSGNTYGIGGVAARLSWDDAAESNDTQFVSATNVNPASGGQYIMGISVAHASGYAFQFGGRDGKIWYRFREAGTTGKWSELALGGGSDPSEALKLMAAQITKLEERVAKLEAGAAS